MSGESLIVTNVIAWAGTLSAGIGVWQVALLPAIILANVATVIWNLIVIVTA